MAEVITGRNPVLEALRAGRPIERILLARNISRHGVIAEIVHLAQSTGIPVEYVPAEAIREHSGTVRHQGVIDRVGSGDAFAAGLIYSLLRGKSDRDALAFGVAAAAWKHSLYGDFNLADVEEIERLAAGEKTGRIRR